MKKLIIILCIALIFGCNPQKDEIQIIENNDEIYLTENQVDQEAQPIGDKNGTEFNSEIKKIVSAIHKDSKAKEMSYPIGLRIYISKDGLIDKVMPLNNYMIKNMTENYYSDKNTEKADAEEINNYPNLIAKKILPYFAEVKFNPALLNGKPVPYRTDIKALAVFDSLGKYKLEMGWNFAMNLNLHKSIRNKDEYYVAVEQMPEPIGGIKAIQEKIRYPEIAKRAGIEGRVYVRAFIDEKGNVVYAEIIKGLGAGCSEAALAAVKATKFEPGRQRGKPVKVQVSVPILFQLQ